MVNFTTHEIRDILISMLVIAGVFAYVFRGINQGDFISLIPVTLVAVGFGFVFHELAHKFMAIKYGFYAEYRLWVEGLVLAMVTAALGFVFAAPGAVYIHGEYISKEENGKISIAGPLTNIALAAIFFVLIQFVSASTLLTLICSLGFMINSFLAFFNLLPVAMLDGAKVLKWNPVIWIVTIGIAFIMMAYPYILQYFY
ncbi:MULTISPECIES: site-2 protease family protein [Methanobacterium]|jgi:Zn-dependent protease|uniref:Site-2 protease family protein n=1 Tax=Methanobacterium subterraneum TaxID=59277 RepID=A0A2H4VC87_9EURY|nr:MULTISPECIES: site-2 protease family protein [Methanobacterium]MBW4258197.1 site-2 protease family protein [Methanobacterium sp. YSL]PKL73628.1 MAG: site-2 protease family protein [Methanobacteriales archaeon HGW-Methanobacteriales-2]AUB55708.1 site-2 protease family protein [Methanobacterium subterraneum]AUB57303.1 site-2 protease family protein [Methanobacterium sp. MZ-A1]AUB60429.1 site-2 protease family protein [Methanobacterium subterraneum]